MSDWTTTEDAILRANYAMLGRSGCALLLPGRTFKAIGTRAHKLGIKGPNGGGLKGKHVPHNCLVCGEPVPVRFREHAHKYNRRRTCSRKCRFDLSAKHHRGFTPERQECDWDNLVAALAARDSGDHSLLQRRLA